MTLLKRKPIRSKKITQSARGEECTLNGVNCNYDSSTTVFCHLNEYWAGKGMGIKSHDIGFYGCSNCHQDYDQNKLDDKYFYILRAVVKTWVILLEKN